jgi:transcriptional regulator with XRE-family HTH domain
MKRINNDIGERIKAAREALNMSQADLARKVGVDASRLCRWERGEEPRFASVKKLAKALGIRPGELLG